MNTIPDTSIRLAATKAARGGNTVRFIYDEAYTPNAQKYSYDTDEPRAPLATILDAGWSEWVVYPSGLALPIPRVNWLWDVFNWLGQRGKYDHSPRIGTAEQAHRFFLASKSDCTYVEAVSPDRVHGTCVRSDSPKTGQYELVQARSFPAWTGGAW